MDPSAEKMNGVGMAQMWRDMEELSTALLCVRLYQSSATLRRERLPQNQSKQLTIVDK